MLDETGEVDLYILTLLDGSTELGKIAQMAQAQFPTSFDSEDQALLYAYDLSQRYTQSLKRGEVIC